MPIYISAKEAKRLQLADQVATPAAPPQDAPSAPRRARAASGEGDRQRDLARLAAAGWCRYEAGGGTAHTFTNPETGQQTPPQPTYRAAIDLALELAGLRRPRRATKP